MIMVTEDVYRVINKLLLILTILFIFIYGFALGRYRVFPYGLVKSAMAIWDTEEMFEGLEKRFEKDIQGNYSASNNYKTINPRLLISVEDSKSVERFSAIAINEIFGRDSLPSGMPKGFRDIYNEEYSTMENLEKIQELTIDLKYNINYTSHVFFPINKNNKSIIYHQGHRGGFVLGLKTIAHFVENGYTVFALSMPLLGLNEKTLRNL